MAKIVDTNVPQIVLDERLPKGRGHIVGFNEIADRIDTNISQIFFVVGTPAQPVIFFLLFLGLQQPFFQKGKQWIYHVYACL
ncbi:hypothetical protein [Pseudoflavonifractor capillosus]|uniref:Uncharacterized protein n=1 Tax=Pseudoflavonifractor capillosus TaxID=106588 RepID=A0A921MM45_9FIRM|nr:hypothetical protein [Pseudoflavonifractor capillosus]HJG87138.1 hypothetical protein [Pseudoflavonifractor capillosus]